MPNDTDQPVMPNEGHDWNEAQRDTYRRLRERAQADAPAAWQPTEPGDHLMGVLVDVNAAAPTKFGPAPVVTIKPPTGGPVSVWLLHTVLRREFERTAPAIGETLLITYVGTVKPDGDARPYESYSVVVDRDAPAVSWGAIAERYDPGAELEHDPLEAPANPNAAQVCPSCGYPAPNHADGCPDDIPF